MIEIAVQIQNEVERVRRAARDAAKRSFARTAFLIRQTAIGSIERAEGPSDPGSPPHTHRRNIFRRSIIYASDKEGAVIGPRFSATGTAGQAHEFGGEYRGGDYPERPFMNPALQKNTDIFASSWNGSIGQ